MLKNLVFALFLSVMAAFSFTHELEARYFAQKSISQNFVDGLVQGGQIGFTPFFGQLAATFLLIAGPVKLIDEEQPEKLAENAGVLVGSVAGALTHIMLISKAWQKHGLAAGAAVLTIPPVAMALLKAHGSSNK